MYSNKQLESLDYTILYNFENVRKYKRKYKYFIGYGNLIADVLLH